MSDWRDVPFSDLLVESRDGEWGEGREGVGLQPCNVVRGTDFARLRDPGVELPLRWIPGRLVDRKRLQPGDIIFEMAGGTATQSTGRSAFLGQSFFVERTNPVLCASFCRHLRLDKNQFEPRFVYYLLQALYRAGYMSVFNIQHTGVSRFQYTSFKKQTKLKIPIPLEQKKIAAILSAYDDLIENNRQRIAVLERMAEQLYREWFVRFRFPGHEHVRFEKGVPADWFHEPASKLFNYVRGKSYASEDLSDDPAQLPFITLKSFNRGGGYRAEGLKRFSGRCKTDQIVHKDDIVMAVTDMTQGREVVGRVARVPDFGERGAVISMDVIKLVPKALSPSFLYSYLRLSGFGDFIKEFANGTNVLHLKPDLVTAQRLLMPPEPLRGSFAELVEPIFEQIDLLSEAIGPLQTSRDLLLPRLISGKLRVDHLDIQFPPSMQGDAA